MSRLARFGSEETKVVSTLGWNRLKIESTKKGERDHKHDFVCHPATVMQLITYSRDRVCVQEFEVGRDKYHFPPYRSHTVDQTGTVRLCADVMLRDMSCLGPVCGVEADTTLDRFPNDRSGRLNSCLHARAPILTACSEHPAFCLLTLLAAVVRLLDFKCLVPSLFVTVCMRLCRRHVSYEEI